MKHKFNFILCCLLFAVTALQAETKHIGTQVPVDVKMIYKKGLAGLAKSQQPNGSFPGQYGSYASIVGMACLCFMASGEDTNYGKYRDNIKNDSISNKDVANDRIKSDTSAMTDLTETKKLDIAQGSSFIKRHS